MPPLPPILAGPIVRRVEPRSVSVWMALPDPQPVTLRLWSDAQVASAAGQVASGAAPLASSAATNPRRFGQRLHVAVVTAELPAPAQPLPPGGLVSYDVDVGGSSLRDQHLLRDESGGRLANVDAAAPRHLALGYTENRLPSFVVPPTSLDRVRIAHASCRKPNGPGYDALAWLDERLEEQLDDLDNRPQQLFLTGDQIYADDVGACLLPMLSGLAADLLGNVERLQITDSDRVDATIANLPALFRQRLVRELAGLSSTDASSHLLSFGEFAAMYLAVWSPRVWRALAESGDVLTTPAGAAAALPYLTRWDACAAEHNKTFAEYYRAWFDEERVDVETFRGAVPKVARALANVATYMIWDDHEVTDDWNLNQAWRTRVYGKPLGRSVVRNGVMAYGVFQAWGNEPKRFAEADAAKPNHNRVLLEQTEQAFAGAGPYPAGGADIDRLNELAGVAGGAANRPVFQFRVAGPQHLVAVLDSRSRRSFQGQVIPPNLLGDTLNQQVPDNLEGRELLIVVSPAPVLGPHLIDTIAQPLLQSIQDVSVGVKQLRRSPVGPCEPQGRPIGAEQYDAEGWAANEEALEGLLGRLARHGRAVILSGDVHYACSLVLDYWRKSANGAEPAPARLVQLTSSPAHNVFMSAVEAVLRSAAFLQVYETGRPPERLAWTGPAPIVIPPGQHIGPGRRARMRRSPALVPARLWPVGTTIPADQPPDWRWRLSLQRDQRPDTARPVALRQPLLAEELNPGSPVDGYRKVAARHAQTAFNHFQHLRQMVFTNNVGLVALTTGSDSAPHVVHTLLSKDAPESTTFGQNTIHDISLAPTTEPRPELVP